jgi:hypothetical protein
MALRLGTNVRRYRFAKIEDQRHFRVGRRRNLIAVDICWEMSYTLLESIYIVFDLTLITSMKAYVTDEDKSSK